MALCDDGRRFLAGQLGEVNPLAPPVPEDRTPFLDTKEHQRLVQRRPPSQRARGMVREPAPAPSRAQRVELRLRMLVAGADPGRNQGAPSP